MRRVATPVKPGATPQNGPHACVNCGGEVFYSVSMSTGSRWLHGDTYLTTCPKVTR